MILETVKDTIQEAEEDNSKVTTFCRFCEFRQNDENGNQTRCELNLLPRYTEIYGSEAVKDVTVFDPEIYVENDEVNFKQGGEDTFKALDLLCLFRRPYGWKKAGNANYFERIYNEYNFDTTFLVLVTDDHKMDDVIKAAKYFEKMPIQPKHVYFMKYSNNIRLVEFLRLNQEANIRWSMENLLDKVGVQSTDDIRNRCFNLLSRKVRTPYMITLDLGQEQSIPLDFAQRFKDRILRDLDRFVCIYEEKPERPKLFLTQAYLMVEGNDPEQKAEEKLKKIAGFQECKQLVKNERLDSQELA